MYVIFLDEEDFNSIALAFKLFLRKQKEFKVYFYFEEHINFLFG